MARRSLLLPIGAVLLMHPAFAQGGSLDGIKVLKGVSIDLVLDRAYFTKHGLEPARSFDVHRGRLLLQSRGNLFDALSSDYVLEKRHAGLTSFTVVPDRGILTVTKNKLGAVEGDRIVDVIELPHSGMRIVSAGEGEAYLYGGQTKDHAVYRISNRRYRKLASLPERVRALVPIRDGAYIATARSIVLLQHGKKPRLALALPKGNAILSLAIDSVGNLFLSTRNAVYALKDGLAVEMLTGLGGELRAGNSVLYVFDLRRKLLVELGGLSAATGSRLAGDLDRVHEREGAKRVHLDQRLGKDARRLLQEAGEDPASLSRLRSAGVCRVPGKKATQEVRRRELVVSFETVEPKRPPTVER